MSKTSDSRDRGEELLRRWRARWDEIPTSHVDLYGKVYAPDSLDQLMLLFRQLSRLDIGAWRGQADASWKLDPSLVRRWKQDRAWMGPKYRLDETRLREHEKDVIEQTREAGFSEPPGELELLARLQHHGGATRLLDCTKNAFTALWFASQGPFTRSGMLVGFRLSADRAIKVESNQLNENIEDLLATADGQLLWWKPRQSNPRIAAQQGLFVFSEFVDCKWGSVNLTGPPEMAGIGEIPGVVSVLVSGPLKEELDSAWDPLIGYSEATLFPDFDGFAASQGVKKAFRDGAPI